MSHALGSWSGRSSLLAACGLVVSCANIAGIDDLAFDLAGEGGGATASSSTAAQSSSPSSTSSGDTTSDASSSSSSAASSGGEGGTGGDGSSSSAGGGGEGGEPPTGFLPACDQDAYRGLLQDYHSAIWHLDEPESDDTAHDDGNVRDLEDELIKYDADYLAETGSLTREVPGVFLDHTAVTFSGGARAEVPRESDYYPNLYYEEGAFTLTFFFKLDAVGGDPVTVLSCIGETSFGEDRGWRVLLIGDELVLELVGSRKGGRMQVEQYDVGVLSLGVWHFVLLARDNARFIRGYLDTDPVIAEESSIFEFESRTSDGLYSMGAASGEADATAVTLDEVAMSFEAMSVPQIDSIHECLTGEGCSVR